MAIYSFFRLISPSIRIGIPSFSLIASIPLTTTSSSAEKYYTHLLKHPKNPEKTLLTVGDKLETSCVNEVLDRCSLNHPKLGLRFFIWAAYQSNYCHSRFTYGKACKLFEISRNPCIISDVIEDYREEGCVVTVKSIRVLLNLCREARIADQALLILRKMEEFNCRPDTTVYNVVIRLFGEKGGLDIAMGLMDEMDSMDIYPDMVTYMEMIKAFCKVGRLDDASKLFKVMKDHGCSPNTVAYSALLHGFCRFGSLERALELLGEMEKEGGDCSPNTITYTSVIQSFCEKSRSIDALCILDRMESIGCIPNRVTVSTLIKGLCSEGFINEAHKLINKVIAGGSVSKSECYSSLVISLLRIKRLSDAEKLFRWMLLNEVKPDGLSCSSLIKGLSLEGRVLDGFNLYKEVEKIKDLPSMDSDMYSILLVGLSQQHHLVEATKLASLMVERRIQIKAEYVRDIIEHIKGTKGMELLLNLCRMGT
ncbi:hypothetical protein Nepgr_031693 [Nepenthes gracilis]|uniref:Pentatricopeptide repeat-containing protein n=1 Tax=Nepenthes gracilis TaxID=150966 RepID=A0AAD3Y730_NEPGR|nr:hypothetical protein Nepgr_031693 [Nepenthes gracilis]